MRSAEPIPGSPWPHDMVLQVHGDDEQLLELLWVREAWALEVRGEGLPPRPLELARPPLTVQALRRDKGDRERGWPGLWRAAMHRLSRRRAPRPRDGIDAAALGRLDIDEVHRLIEGPSWRGRFGDDAFSSAYEQWRERLQARREGVLRGPLLGQPEWRALDELVPAWRRGLTSLITIPCEGVYTVVLGDDTMLLTEESREDPDLFRQALRSFGP